MKKNILSKTMYEGMIVISLFKVELTLVRFDHANKRVRLLLKGHELLPHLVQSNDQISENEYKIAWHPEATDYMIEGVPSMPYGFLPSYLNIVEANIRLRRQQAQDLLNENADSDYVLSLCAFPRSDLCFQKTLFFLKICLQTR